MSQSLMPKSILKTSLAAAALFTCLGSSMPAFAVMEGQTLAEVHTPAPIQSLIDDKAQQPQPSSLMVNVGLDHSDATYAVGDLVRLTVKANEDAYVTVFDVGPAGNVTQLFPNNFQTDNKVKAGEDIEIPGKASGSVIKVGGPVGKELIKVVATSKPVKVVPDASLKDGVGIFKAVDGGAETLGRDLAVVAEQKPEEVKVAVANQIVTTTEAASKPEGQSVLLVPFKTPEQPAVTAASFPLLLAADKQTYRVGEPVSIAVTPTKACYLSVLSIDEAGKARLLFPTTGKAFPKVDALQTVFVSGGNSGSTISGNAAGEELLVAHCTSEQRKAIGTTKSAEDILSADDKGDFDRDLTVVAGKPAVAVGHAQLVLTIKK